MHEEGSIQLQDSRHDFFRLTVWLGGWKNERIENKEKMEKREDKKDFSFLPLCLVGRVKK